MKKQEQIQAKLSKPIELGDKVVVIINYDTFKTETIGRGKKKEEITTTVPQVFRLEGDVYKLENGEVHIDYQSTRIPDELKNVVKTYFPKQYQSIAVVSNAYVSPTTYECGSNPFGKEKRRINFYNQDLSSLLFKAGYKRSKNRLNWDESDDWGFRVNFDPYVKDKEGNKHHFQRGLVWTLEQKQLLIESIYQGIEIGKFLFRYNSYKRIKESESETGVGYGFDCIDGKQRFNTIVDFCENKFPDLHGNYWEDLSADAQRRFMAYPNLAYGEMDETATDEDILDNFLTLNHAGTPMSREHIDFVRSINLK
jgi:hypothetical protein